MKLTKTLLIVLILFITNVTPAFAATGYQGKALYRNGVLGGVTWHAAICTSVAYNGTVVQADGSNPVRTDTYTNFLAGNTYEGARYVSGMGSGNFDNVLYMAQLLANKGNITYTFLNMLNHNALSGWIYTSNVQNMRCDGVVEYCYEYYGYKIMCDPYDSTHWDISDVTGCYWHNYYATTIMNPEVQARWMTTY